LFSWYNQSRHVGFISFSSQFSSCSLHASKNLDFFFTPALRLLSGRNGEKSLAGLLWSSRAFPRLRMVFSFPRVGGRREPAIRRNAPPHRKLTASFGPFFFFLSSAKQPNGVVPPVTTDCPLPMKHFFFSRDPSSKPK